jgi:cytochrome c-type biogenesis protein CcmH
MLMFWLSAGVLTVITVAALLASGTAKLAQVAGRSEGALAIYKDQLAELERDCSTGVLGETEAEAQRTEISRRLLSAAHELDAATKSSSGFPKVLVLIVPMLAAALYWHVGNFGAADVPHQQRLAAAEKALATLKTDNSIDPANLDWPATLAVVEAQQQKTPNSLPGWKFLTTSYLSLGRFADAANAMTQVIRISGPSAPAYADLAEVLVFDNQGLMTERSLSIIREALKLDPKQPKALYYAALGLAQEGKTADAKLAFHTLLANAPADAPYRAAVQGQLARLEPNAAAPQLSAEQIQGGQAMKPEERTAMIRSMVDGLEGKLKNNPQDIEGWLRLIRARTVLGDGEKAAAAVATARATFATNAADMKLINDLAAELKLK